MQQQGCKQIYFKYYSTFNNTTKNNINPITNTLINTLNTPFTIFSPTLPINKHTIYQKYLFIINQLLTKSKIHHHPINPITNNYLPHLIKTQSTKHYNIISTHIFKQNINTIHQKLTHLQQKNYHYTILNTLTKHHLKIQKKTLHNTPLITNNSNLTINLTQQ